MREPRGANFPRMIAPHHRSNSATLKETTRAAWSAELVSSGCDRVQKSICHLVRAGARDAIILLPRGPFFFTKRSRNPLTVFSRALINDFFSLRGIEENVETTGCSIDDSSRYFDALGNLSSRIFKSKIKIRKTANIYTTDLSFLPTISFIFFFNRYCQESRNYVILTEIYCAVGKQGINVAANNGRKRVGAGKKRALEGETGTR